MSDLSVQATLAGNAAALSRAEADAPSMTTLWWRLVPLMMAGLFLNVLDRYNIAFAALQMNGDLGLSNTSFGLGAGFLAVGMLIFGIPSTLLLQRIGARRWISVTLIAWGLCSAATAFVSNAQELCIVRLFLGMAEAGFVPGSVLYFSQWFPNEYRGRVLGTFIFVQPVALLVGGPLSGVLLSSGGAWNLAGWQWLFIVEALPTLLLAVLIYRFLPDSPAKAPWLRQPEKRWLEDRLAAERAQAPQPAASIRQGLHDRRVWVLAAVYLAFATSGAGPNMFLPLIIRSMGHSVKMTGVVFLVPTLAAMVLLPFWGMWADRARRPGLVVATASGVIAAGLAGTAVLLPSSWSLVPLSIAMTGFYGFTPAFWTIPPTLLVGVGAATGIALISVVGNGGTLVGPSVLGWLLDTTGSYETGLLLLAAIAAGASAVMIAWALRRDQ